MEKGEEKKKKMAVVRIRSTIVEYVEPDWSTQFELNQDSDQKKVKKRKRAC
jgi:hypothetical protein